MFFHASFEAGLKARIYSNVPQRKYDRQQEERENNEFLFCNFIGYGQSKHANTKK